MTVQPLLILDADQASNPDCMGVLRQQTLSVLSFDDKLHEVVQDLKDTMDHHDIAIGLAAPQIGVSMRVAVIDRSILETEDHLVIVNPWYSFIDVDTECMDESCMSISDHSNEVCMPLLMRGVFSDEFGIEHDMTFQGFAARVFRHETDHLDGTLCIDYTVDKDES